MQQAENCTERHTRTRRTRIAAGEHLSAALQPEPLPAGLRSYRFQPGSHDQGDHRRDHGWYVTGGKSTASSKPCATSGSGGRRCDGSTFPSLTARPAPWAYRRGRDKLLQEVIRMILEAYYEPQFSDRSHGFRPDRGCHTALSNMVDYLVWCPLVRRGRHQRVLRQHRPRGNVVGARREAPRQPIPTPAQVPTESRLR